MMQSDHSQQTAFHNTPQQNAVLQQLAQALLQLGYGQPGAGFGPSGFGQAAYGSGGFGPGVYGGGQGLPNWSYGWGGGFPQRQLSPQDVSAILQQIAPVLPQVIAQAQQQQYMPQAAFGGGFGWRHGSLSPQDVNEVVRQILPAIPQLLQSMQGQPWQAGSLGFGQMGGFGQYGGFGQPNMGFGQAAYGWTPQASPFQHNLSRQLTPQDVAEIARQLAEAIPQTMGGQTAAQPRV